MLRVLRKYNRLLLAVFGSGIMIVFLLGNADIVGYFSGLGSQSSWVARFGDGREITRQELSYVQQEMQTIDRLGLPPLPLVGDITRDADLFIQLLHEAKQAGMIGGPGSLRNDPAELLLVAQNTGMNPVIIRNALSDYEGMRRYLQWIIRSGMLSDNRLVREGRRQMEGVDAQFAVITAKAEDASAAPTDDELLAQFDAWKDTPVGEGDHGFGYRLPDRAAIEWLIVPRVAVEAGLRQSVADDDTDVRMFWRRNEGRFGTIGDTTDIPAVVTDAWVREATDRRLLDLERAANDVLRSPRRGFESVDGVVKLPADWADRQVAMGDLRTTLIEQFGLVDTDIPPVDVIGDLTQLNNVASNTSFRFAGTDRFGPTPQGRSRWALADLLGSLSEFGGGAVPLQAGIMLPVLSTPTGDRIFIRVTEAEGNRAPHDLAEVMELVDTDLRRLSRYHDLLGQQGAVNAMAVSGGLDAVASTWNVEITGPSSLQRNFAPGLPRPASVPGLGIDKNVVATIVDRSIAMGNAPLRDVDAGERIVVIPSDRQLALVVARLDRRVPVSDTQWISMIDNGQIVFMAAAEDFGGQDMPDLAAAFTAEALTARHGYVRNTGDDEDDADTTDDAATDDDATTADAS